jgi:Tfp pilus assembly protein PilO
VVWDIAKMNRQYFSFVAGFIALILVVFWVFKIRNIQRLRGDIVQVEIKLSKGQELWRNSPPLTPREKENLQKAQERLLRMLPKEKDVPSVLQDVSRVARDYNLGNLSLSTGDGAKPPSAGQSPTIVSGVSQPVIVQPVPPIPPVEAASSGAIDSFVIRVVFASDFREIAYFLEALQKIPRLMTIQSLQLQRALPLVMAEVALNAYYQKGDLAVKVK